MQENTHFSCTLRSVAVVCLMTAYGCLESCQAGPRCTVGGTVFELGLGAL